MGSELSNSNNMIIRWRGSPKVYSRSLAKELAEGKKRRDTEKFPRKGLFVPKSKYWHEGCRSEMLIDRKKIRKHVDAKRDEKDRYAPL